MVLVGVLATLITLGLVLWLAVVTADGPEPGAVPVDRVHWGALNSGAIEDAARSALGLGEASDPALAELARHHAFAMAARGFTGEVSPAGEDHAARRSRLAPLFVGTSRQVQASFPREKGDREAEVGQQGAGMLDVVAEPGEAHGVGAAVEGRQCAVVVVSGQRVATLDQPPTLGVSAGLWALTGRLEAGVRRDELRAQLRRGGDGAWEDAATAEVVERNLGEPDPTRFAIELDLPVGEERLDVRVLRDQREVLLVTVREGAAPAA